MRIFHHFIVIVPAGKYETWQHAEDKLREVLPDDSEVVLADTFDKDEEDWPRLSPSRQTRESR